MKLIHTADWHLGRSLHGASLVADQAHVLEQFVGLVQQERPDAVLVAGDVFDRAVPPVEAIELLEEVLYRLVLDLQVPVILIAGNHDSPTRLAFGARLLAAQGLHVCGEPRADAACVELRDAHGPVRIYPIPFAEPAVVRHLAGRPDLHSHQEATQYLVDQIRAGHPAGVRSVAVAHCFVTGAIGSESERPLSVGGAESVAGDIFQGFAYVALGHLHRPQHCGQETVRYSGSLLRYSFSEATHEKAVLVVTLDARGQCAVQEVALSPRRQVRRVQGKLAEVVAAAPESATRDDYLVVELQDEGPVYDAMGKLREVYPNVLHIERAALTSPAAEAETRIDHRRMGDLELFAAFFEQVTGGALSDRQREVFASAADEVRRSAREVDA